eukprot:gene3021-5031_t
MFFFKLPKETDEEVILQTKMKQQTKLKITNCTYSETGPEFTKQIWFECKTCNTYCCEFCKLKCHENHDLSEENNSDFYCDCGCSTNCKGLRPKVFSLKKDKVKETIKQDMNFLYVFAYFPENSNPKIKQFFQNNLFEESKNEKNVRFFIVEEDDEYEDISFEFYKHKRECGFKELTEDDLKEDLESIYFDLDLYFKANYLAHKNPVPLDFEGIIEESDEEDEEEDEEEEIEETITSVEEPKSKKQKLESLLEDEYDEEDDEDFDPEQPEDDEEYEDEENVDFSGSIGTSGQTISHEDFMPFWSEVYQELDLHTLYFTTFRNSSSAIVKDLLFTTNPVMKQLAAISDPAAPDHRDLVEVLKEATEFEDFNPEITKEIEMKIESLLKSKKDIKEWKDDEDYEFSEDKDLKDSKNEWKVFGGDLLRLNIGTWSTSGDFKAQFRFKVDPINKEIIYHMFDFKVEKKKSTNKEDCIEFLNESLKKFKESNHYKIVVPLESISALHYHASEVDPSLSLLVYDVKQKPSFFVKKISDEKWNEIEDFSENYQASKCKRHTILGYDAEFSFLNHLMNSVSKNCSSLYEEGGGIEDIQNLVYFDENDKGKKNNESPFLSNLEDAQENCMIQ